MIINASNYFKMMCKINDDAKTIRNKRGNEKKNKYYTKNGKICSLNFHHCKSKFNFIQEWENAFLYKSYWMQIIRIFDALKVESKLRKSH